MKTATGNNGAVRPATSTRYSIITKVKNSHHIKKSRFIGCVQPVENRAQIDHRRVPNLQTFFSRHGQQLPVSAEGSNYQAGDLVTWMLAGNLPYIGIVTDKISADGLRPLIVHNIGAGTVVEDMLFSFPVTGHYRYFPADFR